MQVPSVGYGGPMAGGENEYERRQNIGGVGLIGARGSIDDGTGGGSAHPVFHTGPWDMEHQYSEIPAHPSSMELLRHEPFHIQDLKGMDYNHHINHHHHHAAQDSMIIIMTHQWDHLLFLLYLAARVFRPTTDNLMEELQLSVILAPPPIKTHLA